MEKEYREEDYLQLSGIQHFLYCRRQWALIHIEQQWSENGLTTDGKLFHQRVHDENAIELRGDTLSVRGMRISSCHLGITGCCDLVEFHRVKEKGISLQGYLGQWSVTPIEYKRGKFDYWKRMQRSSVQKHSVSRRCCAARFRVEYCSGAKSTAE